MILILLTLGFSFTLSVIFEGLCTIAYFTFVHHIHLMNKEAEVSNDDFFECKCTNLVIKL